MWAGEAARNGCLSKHGYVFCCQSLITPSRQKTLNKFTHENLIRTHPQNSHPHHATARHGKTRQDNRHGNYHGELSAHCGQTRRHIAMAMAMADVCPCGSKRHTAGIYAHCPSRVRAGIYAHCTCKRQDRLVRARPHRRRLALHAHRRRHHHGPLAARRHHERVVVTAWAEVCGASGFPPPDLPFPRRRQLQTRDRSVQHIIEQAASVTAALVRGRHAADGKQKTVSESKR